jgi:hypothetical protein
MTRPAPSTRLRAALAAAALLVAPASLAAGPVAFDGGWREQGFPFRPSNDYALRGNSLEVASDGTVSLLWAPVAAGMRGARAASWAWSVERGVPPTDLGRRGGDDRNLALYFAFADPETARRADLSRGARLLREPGTRVLVYVWGGGAPRGTVLRSPYLDGLRTVVLRPAGTGAHRERVDLAADHRRAFGSEPGVLLGMGVSADSDDTDSEIRAVVSDLVLR